MIAIHSEKAAIFDSLNALFLSLLDESRSGTAARPWPELIALMAIRFLAGDQGKSDHWTKSAEVSFGGSATAFFRRLSEEIERENPQLEGVFSRSLLAGIERIHTRTLDAWAFRLARVSLIGTDREAFGLWVDAQFTSNAFQATELMHSATPPSVAQLMVRLANVANGSSILDPCCGIGSLLTSTVSGADPHLAPMHIFGQELSPVSWALCRLRLFLLGQDVSFIALGDSLRQPAFAENTHVKKFDCVLCDPPLGLALQDAELAHRDPYDRFVYAAPGRGPAEGAFVQHAAASMKPNGKSILLVSHGFLFRLGNDARIREGLIRDGRVQAVIGLPAKLRPSTAIETALVVLGENLTGEVLVVDASRLQPTGRGRTQLSEKSITEILQIFEGTSADGPAIARRVAFGELADSEFSLLPRRYLVAAENTDTAPDLISLREELRAIDDAARAAAAEMDLLLEAFLN